jgi:membrane-associated phospholipid phosphatase
VITRSRRYVVIGIIAVVALVLGLGGPMLLGGKSAKDRIEADPHPVLFSDVAIAPADQLVDPQAARAHALMQKWWASHGQSPNDTAFLAWLGRSFPEPPSKTARRRELVQLRTLDRQHTPQGVRAATWLEVHGKKDIWKLYAHDQAEWLPSKAGDARKSDVKALLKLSKKASHQLSAQFGASAPYVLAPALAHKSHHIVNGCPCSYPSNHASKAAAIRTYLGAFQPHMTPQYRWMEDEVDWSRIYMAGHVASDISGGALLGDMVGEYFLVTRAGRAPQALPAA